MALGLTFNSSSSVPSNLSPIGRFFERPCGTIGSTTTDCDRTDGNTIGSDDNSHQRVVSKVLCEADDKESSNNDVKIKDLAKMRSKRPARLVVPEILGEEFCEKSRKVEISEEFEIRGRGFSVASKKGRRRDFMEDNYGVLLDIMGDPKQAFFTVIDGHGGRAAADYVAENLGKNIAKKFEDVMEEDGFACEVEEAVREGYLDTDKGFLSQGVNSGACAASVIVKSGNLCVANVGDCRVVICRNGVAHSLTKDHRLTREDERFRIENSGGFVHCNTNGVWRVQGSLAVSRAMGDQHLKQWVISEPEIKTLPLTPDCKFLIIASDGLWDKVSEQEAVDVVAREIERNSEVNKACKKLVEMSSSRGNLDDITVMVVNLESFSL